MSTEKDNRMVWDRQKAGQYEVWYTTFNHRRSDCGFWIRYTLSSPLADRGEPYCQIWFAFFNRRDPRQNFAINRKLPMDAFEAQDDPFCLTMGESLLKHGSLRGSIEGDAHSASWDLAFKPTFFTHRHLPDMIYDARWPDAKVCSPNLMIHINGSVIVDGETLICDGEAGCQTHIWGRKHAHAWAWSHCNNFREDPTACLETLSIRLKRAGLVTPPMTFVSLYLGNEVYHFKQFHILPLTRGRWETGLYRFSAVGRRIKVEGELRCRPEDLVRTPYTDPDGEASFCHNTEVADASLTVWSRRSLTTPFRETGRLTSQGTAHFEYAARSPDGHVTRQHVTV